MSLADLADGAEAVRFVSEASQNYPPSGGSSELRAAIASLYQNASSDHIHVTNGATEANFLGAWRILEEGDEIVVMVPGYMQTRNLARSWGLKITPLPLREDTGWQFDPEDLKTMVNKKTKAIQVCNPNNPTGAVMADEQRTVLVDCAKDSGAWILSDEVYIGAELERDRTKSLWGDYERTLVTNGLCKAYGLPGLRIGWLVGMPEILQEITSYHDYLTLTHAMPCDHLARLVLEPERRERIIARNQAVIREGHRNLKEWASSHDPKFSFSSPEAGPMCFINHSPVADSFEFAKRLLKEKSVLVVPGCQMGMDGYVRIGTSVKEDLLNFGLSRLDELLNSFEDELSE
ncbi:MAG: aminotransferase class I/II-fold pyridoxal phosphate-dependent enzyme [Methanobacteriota archaeon]|nr:MAG: aminotransferase class I/II-fold pyridoxal phosphate-dependent enzyme [Euryarchaeota archaeon]